MYKILIGSLVFISLYGGAIAFAMTYVSPGSVLDPSGTPGNYTVGPLLSYGSLVTSGHNNEVLYNDASGNLASDTLFTRSSGAEKNTNISSNTYAQGAANDGMSQQATFQADTIGDIGNSITLVFNGTDTAATVVSAWNLAHPNNTVSIVAGSGSTVPTPGTTKLIGGGTVEYDSGTFNALTSVMQGAGTKLIDQTNGISVFNFLGNLSSLTADSALGYLFGASDNAGNTGAGIFSPGDFHLIATDQNTYNASIKGDKLSPALAVPNDPLMPTLASLLKMPVVPPFAIDPVPAL